MSLLIDIEHRSFEATLQRCADLGGADLAFFSPPYPTEVPGAKGREGAPTRRYGGGAPEHFLWPDYQRLGDCVFQALKPGGFVIVIVDGPIRFTRSKKIGSERSLIAFRLAIDWAERVGFRYVEHEAYLRLGPPGDYHPRRRSGWEPMHVFQRPGRRGYFDSWAVTMPSKTSGELWRGSGSMMWNGKIYQGPAKGPAGRRPSRRTLSSAVEASPNGANVGDAKAHHGHPAPFSAHIAEVQVLSYSPPGGLVCDPFNGSGTTGIAAAKYGRNFVGGDLGAREGDGRRWADIGRERALEAAGLPPGPRGEEQASQPAKPVAQQLGLL